MNVFFKIATLFVLCAGCLACQNNKAELKNGWYFITDKDTNATSKTPIVTVTDFETVRLDSSANPAGTVIYQIVGKIKQNKVQAWADATEKSIGKQIGFLYGGEVIAAPRLNQRIESGNFAISTNRDYDLKALYQAICKEMK